MQTLNKFCVIALVFIALFHRKSLHLTHLSLYKELLLFFDDFKVYSEVATSSPTQFLVQGFAFLLSKEFARGCGFLLSKKSKTLIKSSQNARSLSRMVHLVKNPCICSRFLFCYFVLLKVCVQYSHFAVVGILNTNL